MNDPTYVREEIDANPIWTLAFILSELDNDNAPIGWGKYIPLATALRAYTPKAAKLIVQECTP